MQKTVLKQGVQSKIFAIFLFINIIGFIVGGCLVAVYILESQKHEGYYSSIITGIGFILGLIVVVTIFYLGKYHDYYKNILEILNKNGMDFDSYMDSFNIADKKFEKLDGISVKFFKLAKEYGRDNIEELEELYEQEKKHRVEKLMTFEKIKTELKCEVEEIVNLSKYSRNTIINFLLCAIPFVILFLLFTLILEGSTVGKFYFLIVQMVTSIVNFLLYWFLTNERINNVLEYYNSMLEFSRTINNAELQEKNRMRDYEKWENIFW